MKRIFIVGFIICGAFGPSFGQLTFDDGSKQLNAGFGLSTWGLPIYVGLDFGVHPDITIGPQVSYRSYSETYTDFSGTKYKYGHSIFVASFNGNYHFNTLLEISSQWDVYAGLRVAYYVWSSPSNYLGARGSGIGMDGQIGARYFFSDKLGVNLEFGGGTVSGGKFGITLRL